MTAELRQYHVAQELYLSSLTSAWRRREIRIPSMWLGRDPEAASKMLRNEVIGQAVEHRCNLIAGKEWNLVAKNPADPRSELATAVGTEILKGCKKFAEARKNLARAFFHGQAYAQLHFVPRVETFGDGVPRTWRIPVKMEDHNQFRYRKVVADPYADRPKAHWQKWEILGPEGGRWRDLSAREAVAIVSHVYGDTEETMGYGKGLREALGWTWYALTHVNQETLGAIERFARGWVHAKVDGARHRDSGLPNTEVVNEWLEKLEDMQSRHVLVSSKDDEVEVLGGSMEGWQMLTDFRSELRDGARTLILSANLPTAASEGGSYALGGVQENSTEMLIQFDRDTMDETISTDVLGAVWYENYPNLVELGIAEECPLFSTVQEKQEDPKEVAEVAATLNGMGVDLAADDLYDRTGFKKPEPGEDIIEGASAPAAPAFGMGSPFGAPQPPGQQGALQAPQEDSFGEGVPGLADLLGKLPG